jgi:hypothetical protein
MKKSATTKGESPSRLIDARIKELDDCLPKSLRRTLMEIDSAPGVAFKFLKGSLSEAPLEKVSFTTLLYVSSVQISPS